MVEFYSVCKMYDNGVEALKNVSLKVEKGEFLFLIGRSGAGKSTLIKVLFREATQIGRASCRERV